MRVPKWWPRLGNPLPAHLTHARPAATMSAMDSRSSALTEAGRILSKVAVKRLLVAALVLTGGLNCNLDRLWFKRSASLSQVAGNPHSESSLTQPTWTPDGTRLYYLTSSHTHLYDRIWGCGALWQVDRDGANAHQVLSDTFCALAVSPDGLLLALVAGRNPEKGGRLAVYHVGTEILDTLTATKDGMDRVLFARTSPPRIYYYSWSGGVYRANIDGTGEELISPSADEFFKTVTADSVVLPWVHPAGRFKVGVGYAHVPLSYAGTRDIVVVGLTTQDTTFLHANPYKYSTIEDPSWSPDGNSVVFAAGEEKGDPLMTWNGQLWILHDAAPGND